MTISEQEIQAFGPDVPAKAEEKRGFKNPFITLQGLNSLCESDEALDYCLHEVVIHSLRYTETICRFEQIVARGQVSNEDGTRKEIEKLRTAVHDSTMSSINLLARNMKRAGKDTTWVSKVTANSRASYALFAMMVAFEAALNERKNDR